MSNQPTYLDRPPRIQPVLPVEVVEIPAPPKLETGRQQPLWQLAVPLISIGGYVLVSATGQGSNIGFLIPMMLGVLVSSGVAVYTALSNRQKVIQKQADYTRRLAEMRQQMTGALEQQRAFYQYSYPDVTATLSIDGSRRDNRSGSRLWERRNTDEDFGAVRIGLGARPSSVIYHVAKADNEENPQMRDAERLADDSRTVYDVPLTLALYQLNEPKEEQSTAIEGDLEAIAKPAAPIVHHAVGLTGSADQVYPFIQAMAAHMLAFHAPDDLQMFVVGRHHVSPEWDWIVDLPHARTGKTGTDLTWHFESAEGKHEDKEQDGTAQFWKQRVYTELDRRAQRLRDREDNEQVNVKLPFMWIIVDLLDQRDGTPPADADKSALRDLESEAAISLLIRQGAALGAAIFFLVPERSKVPSGCQAVLELTTTGDGQPGFLYAEVGLNTTRYVGVADQVSDPAALQRFALALAKQKVRRSYGSDMPSSVLFLDDLFNVGSLDELPMLENWQQSMDGEADWLQLPLGQSAGGELTRLKLAAAASGVHGMIAGSTGSGKSELLMTFILSLAVRYDPRIVNFVLIDFKGGAAFDPFDELPHKVDKVTNLSPGAVARMFAAINAELNRRQEINRRTGCKDIIEYRRKGYHRAYPADRYAHLFIIIDEFAEMIANNPEYRAQLESITRLGRSLGVNLLLAAQRPSGVSDQMRANIKFRICLRVETREESRELLHRPDASFLPTGVPGRGYLQVGNDNLQEIQVAFSGSEYVKEDMIPDLISEYAAQDIIAVDDVDQLWEEAGSRGPKGPPIFSLLVLRAARLNAEQNIPPQRKPWPNPLPRHLTLTDPHALEDDYLNADDKLYLKAEIAAARSGTDPARIADGLLDPNDPPINPLLTAWLSGVRDTWPGIDSWATRGARAAIGIMDNPTQAEVKLLLVDLTRGHHAIFGASGWGKTTLIRSLLIGLAASHSPDELRLYFLDFGGRQLRTFEALPHTGAYILPTEAEKVRRLLRTLEQEIDQRSQLLSSVGKGSILDYNDSRTPDMPLLPAIVVVIDNFAEFRTTFESQLDVLTALIGTGLANGVYFVVTGTQVSSLGRLYNQIPERLTLKLADESEYASIVGRGARFVEECPGRGFRAIGRTPIEFQVALPIDEAETDDDSESASPLTRLIERWRVAAGTDRVPVGAIDVLPEQVFLQDILKIVPPPTTGSPEIVLGIQDDDLKPSRITLGQKAHFIISGAPTSGKTSALYTWILSLTARYSAQSLAIVLADSQGKLADYGGQKRLDLLPHVLQACITEPDKFRELPDLLENEYRDSRSRQIFVIFDNYDDIEELNGKSDKTTLHRLGNLARRYGARGLHFVIGGSATALRSSDDFTRIVGATRFGMATDLESAGSSPFNGKVPVSYSSSKVSLPVGRSFLVTAGRVAMLQAALPYRSPDTLIEDLDAWVVRILERGEAKAQWRPLPSSADSPDQGVDQPGSPSNGIRTPAATAIAPASVPSAAGNVNGHGNGSATSALNWQKCRTKLSEATSIPLEMLASIPNNGILEMMERYSLGVEDCM